ncbi:MAG TPA: uracil-DNA glycosylase [Actinomycetaceae bacterium]|nr:uracil-DNA glycosylase [Actinomycetaceae bacterium]
MPLTNVMHPSWAAAMAPVEHQIRDMGTMLRQELTAGNGYLPAGTDVFRAFTYPLDEVKVLIVGQDPYPTPGHPMGLSFSVQPHVHPLPRSLENIYRELQNDVGAARPPHGDLSHWSKEGVMLLNRVLTVRPGTPASHRNRGWEAITDHAISVLVRRDSPLVAILWGRDAQSLSTALGQTPIIASAHPSPLSASRGFFGSRPFSRANAALLAQGATPVEWEIPA